MNRESFRPYSSPEMEYTLQEAAYLLCESPKAGSNEDLTYEEWTI